MIPGHDTLILTHPVGGRGDRGLPKPHGADDDDEEEDENENEDSEGAVSMSLALCGLVVGFVLYWISLRSFVPTPAVARSGILL